MSQLPDPNPSSFDDELRALYHAEETAATPPPPTRQRIWAGVQPHLSTPPAPALHRARVRAGLGGLVAGMLLMAAVGVGLIERHSSERPHAAMMEAPVASSATKAPAFGTDAAGLADNGAPSALNGAPLAVKGAPLAIKGAPLAINGAPLAIKGAPLAVKGAPLAVKGAPLAVNGAPLAIKGAPLAVKGAPLAVKGAPLAVKGVPLAVKGVPLVIKGVPLAATPVRVDANGPNLVGVGPGSETAVPLTDSAGKARTPAVLLPLVQAETAYAALPAADSAAVTRAERRRALLRERAALAALTRRTDSLLLALNDAAFAPPQADSAAKPAAPVRRWSVVLAFAPERNFFGLNAPAGDSLAALRRVHEQGRAGYNAALLAEYRLDNRLSVGAGLGLAAYGAELRLTDRQTHISTRLDSSITRSATVTIVIRDAYSVRTVRDSILAPILNANNQVIGYQYLPTTRLDTVRTRITNTQVDSVTKKTYTPVITTREEVSARILRPNYRFLTVPLLARYRLGRATDWTADARAPRWWADVAVGAQLQWFLGGTQATTRDGRTYQTTRVGPRGGPFRPLSVALTGAVTFNYALTPRLSASLAPTLRWQVESVYKTSTNLTQRPLATGLQLGVRYAF